MVWVILSSMRLCLGVFGTVYSNRIPWDRHCSSNYPLYSPSVSIRTAFSFCSDSYSAWAWNCLTTQNLILRLQHISPQLTTVIINEGNKILCTGMWFFIYITYIGVHDIQGMLSPHRRPRGLGRKTTMFYLLAKQSTHLSMFTFFTFGRSSLSASICMPFLSHVT